MEHQYKLKLVENLEPVFGNRGWFIALNRLNVDGIIFILPKGTNSNIVADSLFDVLNELPEINFPKERVRFIFRIDEEPYYNDRIRLINPNVEDHKIISMGPERFVTLQEYRAYWAKNGY